MAPLDSIQRVIVNADDFGSDAPVNAAILQSFKQGWISHASVMANMPGFEEACQIIHEHSLKNRVGLHLVLTKGEPLTIGIKHQALFCDKTGMFRPRSKSQRIFCLNKEERDAVAVEVATQIEKSYKYGLQIVSLDSHHHIHEEWGILNAILPVVRQFHIPCVRIMRNISVSCSARRKVYAAFFNTRLRYLGLARSRYFGSIYEYCDYEKRHPSGAQRESYEIMVHPILNAHNAIVEAASGESLGTLISAANIRI